MAEHSIFPYIPEFITVHMGLPDARAENVTVTFADYVKNVASSEVYPTWETAALRANILAQISFALNRVYTEHYAARGFPFQITATTAFDQKFIPGRTIFENVSQMVDELFDDYIRRKGNVEPLAARFCNGTTSTCDGMSQWGSQYLAEGGANSVDILKNYYGEDIELVTNAPIRGITASYPGKPLRVGDAGTDVEVIQFSLNRISQDYPAIPLLWPVDGLFGLGTEASVKKYQKIFNLTPDGIVGKGTWYSILRIYTGVKRLSELNSEGQSFFSTNLSYPEAIVEGETGEKVETLQFFLSVVSEFMNEVPFVPRDGVFGPGTRNAVAAFQGATGLPQTGEVDVVTWDTLYRAAAGASEAVELVEDPLTRYPGVPLSLGQRDPVGGETV